MRKIIKIGLVVSVLAIISLSIYNENILGIMLAIGLGIVYAILFIWKR